MNKTKLRKLTNKDVENIIDNGFITIKGFKVLKTSNQSFFKRIYHNLKQTLKAFYNKVVQTK